MKKSLLKISLLLGIQSFIFSAHGADALSTQSSPTRQTNPVFSVILTKTQEAEDVLSRRVDAIKKDFELTEAGINTAIEKEKSKISETQAVLAQNKSDLDLASASLEQLQKQLSKLVQQVKIAKGTLADLKSNASKYQAKIDQSELTLQDLNSQKEEALLESEKLQEEAKRAAENDLINAIKELSPQREATSTSSTRATAETSTSPLRQRLGIAAALTTAMSVAAAVALKK